MKNTDILCRQIQATFFLQKDAQFAVYRLCWVTGRSSDKERNFEFISEDSLNAKGEKYWKRQILKIMKEFWKVNEEGAKNFWVD